MAQADAIVIAAGAGIGVDSGMPDFRSENGFWKTYPALAQGRKSFQDIAAPQNFDTKPALAWGFYGHRLNMYRELQPHAGFSILKKWCDAATHGGFVYTSNVDGHFQKAGFSENQVFECHGSIHRLQCQRPCKDMLWSAEDFKPEVDVQQCLLLNSPPQCPHCAGIARPNILMFNDGSWNSSHSRAQRDHLQDWIVKAQAPLVIEVGAGTAVPAVRSFSHRLLEAGCQLIRINLNESNMESGDSIEIALPARQALEAIDAVIRNNGHMR
ncbi:SIR2 family NAD-dependent protein deacylase [Lampropedia aestuarii]|uniref:SIR2 family NAD-dependent protein deacylase n=1 Tax=Lampropedia aestuarii TaxID=2562762 RepID=UPI0024698E50|nr:Sir2 family NAD-dependent protein deacetylase [Lampropedia aestuarii]MDH5859181.1 Sir2 family NAD-dependent protein deacetylase [Lampropedia aestuarii]